MLIVFRCGLSGIRAGAVCTFHVPPQGRLVRKLHPANWAGDLSNVDLMVVAEALLGEESFAADPALEWCVGVTLCH